MSCYVYDVSSIFLIGLHYFTLCNNEFLSLMSLVCFNRRDRSSPPTMSLKRINYVKSLTRLNSEKNLAKMVKGVGSFHYTKKNHSRSVSVDSQQAKYLKITGSHSCKDDEIP